MSRPPVMRSTAPGADIRLNASTDGSVYLVAAQTEKGAAALEAWRPFLEDGGAEAARSACPTCHCFDISQENRMQEGERFRCWDSCMFSSYTEMAGHHNPRADKASRVRQRFMHKLCFFEDRYGKSLCVGCGRCVERCPVALDITCLIDEIGAADAASLSSRTE